MYNFMMNPMQQSQFQNYTPYGMQQPQSLTRVSGKDGAKAYQMSANSMAALFDINDDKFYLKVTDGAGFPTIRTYRFQEETEDPGSNTADFVNKNDLEEFKKEIMSNVEQYIQSATQSSKQTNTAYPARRDNKAES